MLTESTTNQLLKIHQKCIPSMRDAFRDDPLRFQHFSLRQNGILLDFSKNRITRETVSLLVQLAHDLQLPAKMEALFAGDMINMTEKRPALHTALRNRSADTFIVQGHNIMADIQAALRKMHVFTERVRSHQWRGATGKPIRHIVNIGIGGSYLGPRLATHALHDFISQDFTCHFISTIDVSHIQNVLSCIDPAESLFIISSKSFTTLETMTNAQTIMQWFQDRLGKEHIHSHFVAVTADIERARQFGIAEKNIFPLWDWVGGRYSIWSSIGLSLAIAIGMENFYQFLDGAHAMDQHFQTAPFHQNMPVLLGLLGIWYINFFDTPFHAVVPYSHDLRFFPDYLQQLDMESNGKNHSIAGAPLPYATGPVVFGDEGCLGQHAFHQLLHQGYHPIPVDFLLVGRTHDDAREKYHQDILIGSALSQAQALMQGKTYEEALAELQSTAYSEEDKQWLARHRTVPGNRPSHILFLDQMTPYHLGALIALYEHKIFVQGALWGINSFDQWGVELGKQLLQPILTDMNAPLTHAQYDSSTYHLIQHYKKLYEDVE